MTGSQLSERLLIERLLDDRSHHIEFNGHLTNHVKHAVVALAGLGVPPERIKAYHDNYVKLTPYGYGLEPPRVSRQAISAENWERFLGQRVNYSAYCEFFDREVTELGLDEVLRRYVPRLLPGWVGSFTHAAIHLGWALDIGSRWMAVEGLAYLAFSYVSCHPERADPWRDGGASAGRAAERGGGAGEPGGRGAERPVDSLLRIAGVWEDDGDALRHQVLSLTSDTEAGIAAGIHPELARSGLQFRIARMLGAGHGLIYETPAWIDEQDLPTAWEQLYYVTTLIYLARPGDFVLLHLITALHGMEQMAERLPAAQHREVIRNFWIGMLGILFSGADFPKRTKLAALHAAFAMATDAGDAAVWEPDWRQIIARAAEEEEEHNPKLVYVLRRVWQRTSMRTIYRAAAGQFTTTPELPPSFEEPPTD